MTELKLRSLAPEYQKSSHATYVRHLKQALKDPKNKNIALTGGYGAGKSSILDQFLDEQPPDKKILRISINTLGPDDDEGITNRIQKELVKQLVYRAKPGTIKRSRFAQPKQLSWSRALLEAVPAAVLVVGLLWLFGVRPSPDAFGTADLALPMVAFALLVLGAAWAARWIVGNRLVSQLSTGGTSIQFEKQPDSYFDEYLDEIVAFFEATEPDIVVFEDLDRFDDARIFDSLRELNTLLNVSAHWAVRKERPLRFVYAIKDSLFEKLGEEQAEKDQQEKDRSSEPAALDSDEPQKLAQRGNLTSNGRPDAAAAAIERANRTKFFEIVVPVVPFLSHSNARDLFDKVLQHLKLPNNTKISRALLDLVARHATDMRLMINIGNEFVVYAEKLLWGTRPAPGMTADNLFALVVYKNFHLADFEALPQRASVLDVLESHRREFIKKSVERLQQERRELLRGDALKGEQEQLAITLSDRLVMIPGLTRASIDAISSGGRTFELEAAGNPEFWRTVLANNELTLSLRLYSGHNHTLALNQDQLKELFPEGVDPLRWTAMDPAAVAEKRKAYDKEIASLRGADFADLAKDSRYKAGGMTFDKSVEDALESELAKDLVRRGFINRYYAEYSSVFYGDFLGVDVANFFRNSVLPNEIDMQFKFETENSVENLLAQAPTYFTSSRSALNVQVLDYMLRRHLVRAKEVITFIVTEANADSIAFLDAFFNAEQPHDEQLVALLAEHPWRGLFDYLAGEESIPDSGIRVRLLNVALLNAESAATYDLSVEARELIVAHHADLPAFTEDQQASRLDILFSYIASTSLVVPLLKPLSNAIRRLVINADQYALTADNLRTALGLGAEDPISLEHVYRADDIWPYCAANPETYLEVVEYDEHTPFIVSDAKILSDVIEGQREVWSKEQLCSVLGSSAPEASLTDLAAVSRTVWQTIAKAVRAVPNTANLHAYTTAFGVDEPLKSILLDSTGNTVNIVGVGDASSETIHDLTVAILNASDRLTPSQRVTLVLQLDEAPAATEIDVTEIEPAQDNLLAELLRAKLVPDTLATFEHFSAAGWGAVSQALRVSENADTFLVPDLVEGHAADLLNDAQVSSAIKGKLISELEEFAVDSGGSFLRAAAARAHSRRTAFTMRQLELIAPHVSSAEHVLWQFAEGSNELNAHDVIRIMGNLGDGYVGFSGGPGHEFEIPKTESVNIVLTRLKTAGLVELPRGGRSDRRKVILA